MAEVLRIRRLEAPTRRVRMVLDTDTYNEIDDQFAVVHALRSPDRVSVEALYAAPFFNERSTGPGDGMQKSYDEIHRLLGLMNCAGSVPVMRGATSYLAPDLVPVETEVTRDLIARAMQGPADDPLYVVAIGAITNIASAMLIEPRVIEKIVVVWLGGHAFHCRDTREFNLVQDIPAARVVFDSGVPLVMLPCCGVVDMLQTTNHELRALLGGRNALADYLIGIVEQHDPQRRQVWSKVIWDVAATGWVIKPESIATVLTHSPILTDQCTWSFDTERHLIRVAKYIHRDRLLRDVFEKVGECSLT
jgi:hypothetical protein